MIPTTDNKLNKNFKFENHPSKTYKLGEDNCIGTTDGIEAVKQAIDLIFNTNRYEHIIYSWNYGIDINDLIGKPTGWVIPELERRITEALEQDDRILKVSNFEFERKRKIINCKFKVSTIYGDFLKNKEIKNV